uniref:Ovule protein n=1 Tax=Brugia timori TaxID=42155 RepID=A0A0R3Q9H9_9BILA
LLLRQAVLFFLPKLRPKHEMKCSNDRSLISKSTRQFTLTRL